MKAAILKDFGKPLYLEQVESPKLGTGEVIVKVIAAPIPHYAKSVFSGERQYMLELPLAPGAGGIGIVIAVGPDSTKLKEGDWVLCDPTVRSRDNSVNPDIALQGISARGKGGLKLQQYYRDGSFAEEMRIPTENAILIGNLTNDEAVKWSALNIFLVPFGGLLSIDLKAGETIAISGATGFYGSAAVATALAMGAGCVLALGRNKTALDHLVSIFGDRVRPVVLTGDEETDKEKIQNTAPNLIDCVLDILPPSVSANVVRTAIMTVREYGRISLMGGVGMLGGKDLELPYTWIMRNSVTIKGQWMYRREAPQQLISLVKAGLLSLDHFEITEFNLEDINEAVEYAANEKGAFKLTVVKP
ncbi:alcohol dehydrogenase [Pedobacter sp. UYP30]|uniref:medium chain dehydrogenase/reductase family protein n=1 Tax=Pedobacter sp. UYP30 TaxID=1756400 RepID=UPI0033992079